ncbi:MAG: lysophospholipid acyltransferase family protein [Gemmatimonadaceae bacterium]
MVSDRKAPSIGDRALYVVLRALTALLGHLPWRMAVDFAGWIGTLFYWPLGVRRTVAEKQIAAAFPEFSSREVQHVAKESFRHLGRVAAESALFSRLDGAGILEHMAGTDGLELFARQRAAGRGAIVLTGHLGNWELGGAATAASGHPIDVVVRLMGNPLFDAYLTRTRSRLGMTVVRDRDAVRHTARALRDGHVIAFLIDQSGLHIASSFVNFFGRPAKTPRGPAVLALRLDVPVFFGVSLRQPDGRYHLHIRELVTERTGHTDRDVETILNAYSRSLESFVRQAPEQYFWQHRRWKRQPPDTPPELRDPV